MSRSEFRRQGGRPGGTRAALLVALALFLGSTGCGYFTVDDHELDLAIAAAQEQLEAGNPDAAIRHLRGVARRRAESVLAREMLVEACLERNTIASRRYAEELLRELTELEPGEARHRYALAGLLLKQGYDRYAYQELAKLRALAPDHAGAFLALASYHRGQWQRYDERFDLQAMVASYQRAANLDPGNLEARRHWAVSLILLEQYPEAQQLLADMLAASADQVWPAVPWLGVLHATCRVAQGEFAAGWGEYEAALDRMSASERAPFIDLSLVADPYTVTRLRDLSPDDAADLRRAFWKPLDPTPTTLVNERLVEHYRRVAMADVLYESPRLGLRGFDTARGEMLIRYGEPRAREFFHGYVAGQLVPPHWVHSYKVGEELFTVTFMDYSLDGTFFHAINRYPSYSDLASYTLPQGYAHRFAGRWLDHTTALAGFMGGARTTREELYLAVPVDSLSRFDGEVLQVEAVAFDQLWVEQARVEQSVRLDQAPVGGSRQPVLVHQLELPLAPGAYNVATLIRGEAPDGGHRGAVISTWTEPLEVEPLVAGDLALSDLELAYRVEAPRPGPFTKGDVAVIPNASGNYQDGELLYVYFEIYGLLLTGDRAEYELSYRVRPAGHTGRGFFGRLANVFRNRRFIEARVRESSATATTSRYLAIDLAALEPNRYDLTLRVIDLTSGATAARMTRFESLAGVPAADMP